MKFAHKSFLAVLAVAFYTLLFQVYGYGQTIINGRTMTQGQVTPAAPSGGAATFSSVTDTGLTAGRIVTVGVGGLLEDDADFTYSKSLNLFTATGQTVLGTSATDTQMLTGAINLSVTTTANTGSLFGYYSLMTLSPTGASDMTARGAFIGVKQTNAQNQTGAMYGMDAYSSPDGNGSTALAVGVSAEVFKDAGSGTTTWARGFDAYLSVSNAITGIFTNVAGLYVEPIDGNSTRIPNRWAIYTEGTADQVFFAGPTGAGIAASSTTALNLAVGTTALSSLRVGHGAAPSSPVNGDIWTTTGGLFVRLNGATAGLNQNLLTTSSPSFAGLTSTGVTTLTPAARASGTAAYFTVNTPADTGITASTESIGENHVTATRTWATTGTVALQREVFFAGPTYASAGASQTFTDAFNLYATPPVVGGNAIFTRGHTLGIVDATSSTTSITGAVIVATTVGTAATSVGIGGGNITAGGNIDTTSGEIRSAGNRVNYNLSAYGAGTAYTFTNTAAAVDLGTTDPVVVLDKAGTYLVFGQIHVAYAAATVVAETATIKVRRTNNTPADLSAVVVIDLPVATTLTNSYGLEQIPPFIYTTAATNDSITLFANVSATLGAGSIQATAIGTSLVAIRMY